jgi:hypothetical protein
VVFFSDFFDLDLDESGEASVEVSLLGDFSVLASVFFVVLLVESVGAASVFVESALLFFFVDGLVALSAAGLLAVAGLFVVVDDLVEGDGVVAGTGIGVGFVLTLALADGVMVAAADADAAGVMVAPTLAVAAGVALAFVEAVTPVVVPVVVVPDVEVTPTLKLGVTP